MAFARDLYKTKLCTLYQRGHCPRQSCSFAHGDAELRRFPGSFNGRRDYRGGDLRERLDRRHSPHRKFSPGRDGRGRQGHSERRLSSPHDREHSHSRSPPRGRSSSERRERKRLRLDGLDAHLSDVSEDLQGPTALADESPEKAANSPCPRDLLEEELRQVHEDIDLMNEQKDQLEASLEKKAQEITKLIAYNSELDLKLAKEQDDHKRLGSKMKKFIKVYMRCTRAQEEVKRTQARLQKLVEEFPIGDGEKIGTHGEDSDVNIVSEGEPEGANHISLEGGGNHAAIATASAKDDTDTEKHVLEKNGGVKRRTSTAREKSRGLKALRSSFLDIGLASKEANADERDWMQIPSGNLFVNKIADKVEKAAVPPSEDTLDDFRSHGVDDIAAFSSLHYSKVRNLDTTVNIPATGLAAHAQDEQLEIADDDNRELIDVFSHHKANLTVFQSLSSKADMSGSGAFLASRIPQAQVITAGQYAQYKGDDEEVDVEAIDDGDNEA